MKLLLITVFILSIQVNNTFAQFIGEENPPEVNFSGFLDVYYGFDFGQPDHSERKPFFYNHNRHNEFNVNMALLHLNVDHEKYRANIGVQTGTYAVDNYAAESALMRPIFEANVGISLNKFDNLWLDVGIFPSHLGFESAISMDNPTLTRSLVAENSPYFLSGGKLTYEPNANWLLSLTLCNGWQRISRVDGNSMISLGTQVSYIPTENITLNWSTFYGTEDPDPIRRTMFFNNFYAVINFSENIGLTGGIDIGSREQLVNNADNDTWFAPTAIVHFRMNEQWRVAARAEYYSDENGVIIPTGTPNGFKTTGVSVNFDYLPAKNIAARIELRSLSSQDEIFNNKDGVLQRGNFFFMSSLAVKL